jgi:hypothetical protein
MKRLFSLLILFTGLQSMAQENEAVKEVYSPVPVKVTPGNTVTDAPSDAIILFDGKNLDEWTSSKGQQAEWMVSPGFFTVKKGTGAIQTKKEFTDYQLHIEWLIPENITGKGQRRGNSGVFLGNYEIQILDSYDNETYVNGQAGSVYKQHAPLVNASKKPGEWQSFDIFWTAPRFVGDSLVAPARVTVLHNGILIQSNAIVKGVTVNGGKPFYKAHGPLPIRLQDHGDPSEAISFRNIWLREIPTTQ